MNEQTARSLIKWSLGGLIILCVVLFLVNTDLVPKSDDTEAVKVFKWLYFIAIGVSLIINQLAWYYLEANEERSVLQSSN